MTIGPNPTGQPQQTPGLRRSRSGRRSFGPFFSFGLRRNSRSSAREDDNSGQEDGPMENFEELHKSLNDDAADMGIDDDAVSITSSDDDSIAPDDPSDNNDADSGMDELVTHNTILNSHMIGPKCVPEYMGSNQLDNYEDEDLLDPTGDEFQTAPNVVFSAGENDMLNVQQLRGSTKLPVSQPGRPKLVTTGPIFERNRCTVSLIYGDYEAAAKTKRTPRSYVVASDGSEGSQYAVNWTMGTILRDADESLIVCVMETDTKLDALDPKNEDPAVLAINQRQRQDMAFLLAHQAFLLLQRTELNVKVSCQAVHARNARHMLLDMIDFYAPTMMIVGSRGLETIRGLAGSMSHYLVQKSSVPVMVAHNKLKLPELPRGKADVVNNVRMRHMRLDQAAVEKTSTAAEHQDVPEEEGESPEEHFLRLNRKSLARRPAHVVDMNLPLADQLPEHVFVTDDPQDTARRVELQHHTHLVPGSFGNGR